MSIEASTKEDWFGTHLYVDELDPSKIKELKLVYQENRNFSVSPKLVGLKINGEVIINNWILENKIRELLGSNNKDTHQ